MPIKFRCQHCRQFLGISHKKSGLLVDCPTCGRTIRVPDEQGHVAPVPEAKLQHDSKLANALEELAALGVAGSYEPDVAVAVIDNESKTPKPPTERKPPPVVPPPAPIPMSVDAPLPAKPIPFEMHDPHKPAPVATMQELATLANQSAKPRDPFGDLPQVERDPAANGNGRRGKGVSIPWVITASVLSMWIGFVFGSWRRNPAPQNVVQADPKKGDPKLNGQPVAANPGDPFGNAPSVRGRITFQTGAGERRPDRGARVLFMPEQRIGTAKLDVVGFRSADSDDNGKVASAGLRAAGGDVAIVDDAGNFDVGHLKPGTYRVVALSHFQERNEKTKLDTASKGILDPYFDRPEQLLGKCSYHIGEVKISGKETELWDFSFERE